MPKIPAAIFAWHRGMALILYLVLVAVLLSYLFYTMAAMPYNEQLQTLISERFLSQSVPVLLISLLLFVVGILYAGYISTFGVFPPRYTWVSVMFPDAFIDLFSATIIIVSTGNVLLGLVPFLGHLIAGGPMILGQIVKHYQQVKGEVNLPFE